MPFKVRDVRRALQKKGFVESTDRHHIYLHHRYNGKETSAYTLVSHGADKDDVGAPLVGKMKKQLHLTSSREVDDLVNCPMSEAQYVVRLKKAGVISG